MALQIGIQKFLKTVSTYLVRKCWNLILGTMFAVGIFFNSKDTHAQVTIPFQQEEVSFVSEGVRLMGTRYIPEITYAAVVLVHGSGQAPRQHEFAALLAASGFAVLSYDKRGVGSSGGLYAGPEVGTNNIDSLNLNLLAMDVRAGAELLHQFHPNLPLGLLGFSQAGWIIPIAALDNPLVKFMVLFSGPTVTTLEQLRFQFFTAGRVDFWVQHSEAEVRKHVQNDPDRFSFAPIDPKEALAILEIPGLWLYGEKDVQIPANLCIEKLQELKAQGKPYEYALFPELGHRTGFAGSPALDVALRWIKEIGKYH